MSVFYRDIDVKISNYKSELSKPLVIFERDRGLEIYFNLVEYAYRLDKNPKNLLENLVGAYATVTLVNPDGYEISIDEVEITEDAKVKFVITEDLTDELTEIGTYQLQIHVKNDIKGKKKYPKYFTPDVYCTTTATKFAQDHGANDIPNSNGPVKHDGETNTKPNPKTLAENMSDNGGIVIKPPKKRR